MHIYIITIIRKEKIKIYKHFVYKLKQFYLKVAKF